MGRGSGGHVAAAGRWAVIVEGIGLLMTGGGGRSIPNGNKKSRRERLPEGFLSRRLTLRRTRPLPGLPLVSSSVRGNVLSGCFSAATTPVRASHPWNVPDSIWGFGERKQNFPARPSRGELRSLDTRPVWPRPGQRGHGRGRAEDRGADLGDADLGPGRGEQGHDAGHVRRGHRGGVTCGCRGEIKKFS